MEWVDKSGKDDSKLATVTSSKTLDGTTIGILLNSTSAQDHVLKGSGSTIAIPQGGGHVALPFGICDAYVDLKDPSSVQWVEEANKVRNALKQ